jgi:hypothetical protein
LRNGSVGLENGFLDVVTPGDLLEVREMRYEAIREMCLELQAIVRS